MIHSLIRVTNARAHVPYNLALPNSRVNWRNISPLTPTQPIENTDRVSDGSSWLSQPPQRGGRVLSTLSTSAPAPSVRVDPSASRRGTCDRGIWMKPLAFAADAGELIFIYIYGFSMAGG